MGDRVRSSIPDLVTCAVLVCAVLAIMAVLAHQFQHAAQLILTAALLDWVDGPLARRWSAQSDLGSQLDSLADLVAFGVAPAILVAASYFATAEVMGAVLAAAFALAAGYRLARFNVEEGGPYFHGMSSTAAGSVLAAITLLPRHPVGGWWIPIVVPLALLMVSRLPYYAGRAERGRLLMAVPLLIGLVWALPAPAAILATGVLLASLALALRNVPVWLRQPRPSLRFHRHV